MKRTSLGIMGLFFALFIILTGLNSCEVDHFYEAEVIVVDIDNNPIPGVTVITTVDVDADHEVERNGTTGSDGKVSFSFDNVAILKVQAKLNDYCGEGLLVLEEDEEVQLTVVVYRNNSCL